MDRNIVGPYNDHIGTFLVSSGRPVLVFPETMVERAKSASHDHLQQHHESGDRSQYLRRYPNLAVVISRPASKNCFAVPASFFSNLEQGAHATKEQAIGETENQERPALDRDAGHTPDGIDICDTGDERDHGRCNFSWVPG